MNTRLRRLTGGFLSLSFAASLLAAPALAEDPTINRLLASQCAQCHGTNGYAVGDFEELAGEEAKDLREDVTDMTREDRPEDIMDHQALGYTDAQIRRIADFYATLPENVGDGETVRGQEPEADSEWEDRSEPEEERDEEERHVSRDDDD